MLYATGIIGVVLIHVKPFSVRIRDVVRSFRRSGTKDENTKVQNTLALAGKQRHLLSKLILGKKTNMHAKAMDLTVHC